MSFEGFEGQTDAPAAKDVFWARAGVDEKASPGNGSLPPGAAETPGFPRDNKVTAKTTDAYIKDVVA